MKLATPVTLTLVLGGAMLLAVLNLGTAPGSAVHVPTYVVSLVGKYLSFAILALAVDLVWGFGGILSLGHAAFFALGGYGMGMYLLRQIGTPTAFSFWTMSCARPSRISRRPASRSVTRSRRETFMARMWASCSPTVALSSTPGTIRIPRRAP